MKSCPNCESAEHVTRWGRTPAGGQRYRCRSCLRTFGPTGGNQLSREKEVRVLRALRSGLSIRQAARRAGVAKATAQKYAKGIDRKCWCGEDARHRGWCWFRVALSPRRQQFLRERFGARKFKSVPFRLKREDAARIVRRLLDGVFPEVLAEQENVALVIVEKCGALSVDEMARLLRDHPVETESGRREHSSLESAGQLAQGVGRPWTG